MIVREITERKQQQEELEASRQRIVAAGDAARRKLERNLHDGAQQRLVSLSLSLRLAQNQVAKSPVSAEELLEASREELTQALEELRELARGIHPAVLTDRGLEAALEALAGRAALPVEIDCVPDVELPRSRRGGRLLRRVGGAREHHQVRRSLRGQGHASGRSTAMRSSRSRTTASGERIPRAARVSAACPTAWPR